MKLRSMIILFAAFQAMVSLAEIIDIKNDIPYENKYTLTEATTFKIETSNGQIKLLPAEDGLLTIKASASGFTESAKVDIGGPSDGKFKFELKNAQVGSRGISINRIHSDVMINGVTINDVTFTNNESFSNMSISGNSFPTLDVILLVPPEYLAHVQLKTSNGDISAQGFSETISGRKFSMLTRNASIEIGDLATAGGEISATTSNGGITADRCDGKLVLKSSNAMITARGNYGGDITATTSNGKISVIGHCGGTVTAATTNASIEFNNPDAKSEEGNTSNGKVSYTKKAISSSVKSSTKTSSQLFDF